MVTQTGDPMTEQCQVSWYKQAGANGHLGAKVKPTGLTAGGGEGQLSQAGWEKFQRLNCSKYSHSAATGQLSKVGPLCL